MSWSLTVKIEDGEATVSKTANVKDGTYMFAGHETNGSESFSTSLWRPTEKADVAAA